MQNELGDRGILNIQRVEGVYGGSLPDDVCIRLTGDKYSIIAKGAVGCFLSHVRTWEMIAYGEDEFGIVFEDDALLLDWHPSWANALPREADLIFANDRTQENDGPYSTIQLHPVVNALRRIDTRKQAVGTDCYILTQRGAENLLKLVKIDGYFGHVDVRMLAYSVLASQLPEDVASTPTGSAIAHINKISQPFSPIQTYVLSPPLVYHTPSPVTSQTLEDEAGRSGAII